MRHLGARKVAGWLTAAFLLLSGSAAQSNDISNSTWSEVAAQNTAAPPNGWPGGVVTPTQVSPMMRETNAAIKRFYNHINATKTSAGTANVQALTYSVAPAAYVTGDCYTFTVGAGLTNTGNATLDVNGLGAKFIKIGSDNIVGGELAAGRVVTACYDGAAFQLPVPGGRARGTQATVAVAGTTYTLPLNTAQHFSITLAAACPCTMLNPSNIASSLGQQGVLKITQGASVETLAWGTNWKFQQGLPPDLSIGGANSVVYATYYVADASSIILMTIVVDVR